MTTIHIKATMDAENRILCELMAVLKREGFEFEKYLGSVSRIIMARKGEKR